MQHAEPVVTSLTSVHVYFHVAACQVKDRENTENVKLKKNVNRKATKTNKCVCAVPASPCIVKKHSQPQKKPLHIQMRLNYLSTSVYEGAKAVGYIMATLTPRSALI